MTTTCSLFEIDADLNKLVEAYPQFFPSAENRSDHLQGLAVQSVSTIPRSCLSPRNRVAVCAPRNPMSNQTNTDYRELSLGSPPKSADLRYEFYETCCGLCGEQIHFREPLTDWVKVCCPCCHEYVAVR
jgi:hypothetical protein